MKTIFWMNWNETIEINMLFKWECVFQLKMLASYDAYNHVTGPRSEDKA